MNRKVFLPKLFSFSSFPYFISKAPSCHKWRPTWIDRKWGPERLIKCREPSKWFTSKTSNTELQFYLVLSQSLPSPCKMSVFFQPALVFSACTSLVINVFFPVCLAQPHLTEEQDMNYIKKIVICCWMFPIWISRSQSNYMSLIRIVNDQVSGKQVHFKYCPHSKQNWLGKKETDTEF